MEEENSDLPTIMETAIDIVQQSATGEENSLANNNNQISSTSSHPNVSVTKVILLFYL